MHDYLVPEAHKLIHFLHKTFDPLFHNIDGSTSTGNVNTVEDFAKGVFNGLKDSKWKDAVKTINSSILHIDSQSIEDTLKAVFWGNEKQITAQKSLVTDVLDVHLKSAFHDVVNIAKTSDFLKNNKKLRDTLKEAGHYLTKSDEIKDVVREVKKDPVGKVVVDVGKEIGGIFGIHF